MEDKKPVGRPKFVIDMDAVRKLASIQCTQEEIAAFLGCSVDTLQRSEEFCGVYKKAIETGKSSLRRLQWKAAEKGNTSMLIWLGKQYLAQRDQVEGNENLNITVNNVPTKTNSQ